MDFREYPTFTAMVAAILAITSNFHVSLARVLHLLTAAAATMQGELRPGAFIHFPHDGYGGKIMIHVTVCSDGGTIRGRVEVILDAHTGEVLELGATKPDGTLVGFLPEADPRDLQLGEAAIAWLQNLPREHGWSDRPLAG